MITITALKWAPPFSQDNVRDHRVQWILNEVGWPYRIRLLDTEDQQDPAYRLAQPFGQVPMDVLKAVDAKLSQLTAAGRAAEGRSSPGRKISQVLFAGRGNGERGLTTRQYARLVQEWVASVGLDPAKFGTHSRRRTKAVLIYRRTGNLRAVQLLLGHSKIESTERYLGIEVDNAIEIVKKIDI